jgi:short-subunit dehydrogenase
VVLISRTKSKLETVATEIGSKYNVQTKIIDVDFTNGTDIFNEIKEKIADLNVGILVNNVGISYDCPEYFHSIPNQDKFLADVVNCNIVSVTNLCKIVLPGMLDRKKGVIVNISSMSATIPNPMLTVYSASKVGMNIHNVCNMKEPLLILFFSLLSDIHRHLSINFPKICQLNIVKVELLFNLFCLDLCQPT